MITPGLLKADPARPLSPVLENDCFIAEHKWDEERVLHLPPHKRPMLVRTAALALGPIPGGVLIGDIGDHLTLAVFGRFLLPAPCQLRHGRSFDLVTAREIDYWVASAGRTSVEDELNEFRHAVALYAAEMMSRENEPLDFFGYLGIPPIRDEQLARAECQRLTGSTVRTIQRRLSVRGFLNPNGSVGRWSLAQVRSLLATCRG